MKIVSLDLRRGATLSFCLLYGFLVPLPFFLIFVYRGVPTRNQHMEERMENVLKMKIYNKIFFITGKRHVSDFRKRMSDKYDVVSLD